MVKIKIIEITNFFLEKLKYGLIKGISSFLASFIYKICDQIYMLNETYGICLQLRNGRC